MRLCAHACARTRAEVCAFMCVCARVCVCVCVGGGGMLCVWVLRVVYIICKEVRTNFGNCRT